MKPTCGMRRKSSGFTTETDPSIAAANATTTLTADGIAPVCCTKPHTWQRSAARKLKAREYWSMNLYSGADGGLPSGEQQCTVQYSTKSRNLYEPVLQQL